MAHLKKSRFKPCLGPGDFLLQLSDCMLETFILLAGVGVTPVKAIRVGVGFIKKILELRCLLLSLPSSSSLYSIFICSSHNHYENSKTLSVR